MERFIPVQGPCDGRCSFCDRGSGGSLDRRRPATPQGALFDAAETARGAERVTFGGDEPLAHLQIEGALRRAKAAGVRDVEVMTSGVRLDAAGVARGLVDAGATAVVVPLYGPDAATHDAIVGTPGSFDRLGRGIHSALAAKLAVRVQSLVLRANLGSLRDTDALARSWTGAGLAQAGHVLPRNADPDEYRSIAPRYADVVAALSGSMIPLGRFPLCIARRSLPSARGSDPGDNPADLRTFIAPCEGCKLRPSCSGVPLGMLANDAEGDLLPERS